MSELREEIAEALELLGGFLVSCGEHQLASHLTGRVLHFLSASKEEQELRAHDEEQHRIATE